MIHENKMNVAHEVCYNASFFLIVYLLPAIIDRCTYDQYTVSPLQHTITHQHILSVTHTHIHSCHTWSFILKHL